MSCNPSDTDHHSQSGEMSALGHENERLLEDKKATEI